MHAGRWPAWPDCPASVRGAVDGFVGLLQDLEGPRLVGVYLHGSLALGGFNPSRSDLDLLAVVRADVGAAFRRSMAACLLERSAYPHPFEVHVLRVEDLNPWRHPAPFAFHYSEAWRERMRSALASAQDPRELMPPVDPDLAAHVMVVRRRGICLWGEPIEDVFPEVPPGDYRDAILKDVADAPLAVHENPVDTVLNLCRVVRYLADGDVAGKAEAGAWAAATLPRAHGEAAAWALAVYRGEPAADELPAEQRAGFVRYMMQKVLEQRGQGAKAARPR